MKYHFVVADMSCAHCKAHIERALGDWGKASAFTVDLASKRVEVESEAGAAEIVSTIDEAGYTAVLA